MQKGLKDAAKTAIVIAGMLMAGCSAPPPSDQPGDRLKQQFETLIALGLRVYWRDSSCTFLAYHHGTFSSDPGSLSCLVVTAGRAKAFDQQATTALEGIATSLRDANLGDVDYIGVDGPGDGLVGEPGTFFNFGPCTTYVYEPGYVLPSQDDLLNSTAHPVDVDWYLIENC